MAQLVKIFCMQDTGLNVSIRDKYKVVLAPADPSDKSQQWFKDYCATGKVTDDEYQRAFSLVNKATREAMVAKELPPSDGSDCLPVYLVPYKGDEFVTISMLWTEGQELDGGFREVRVLKDIQMTLNGLYGNVKDGTVVGVYPKAAPSVNAATPVNAVWKMVEIYQ